MASASISVSEDHFLCSICVDVFTDPVATACGHNYCKACITHYWDISILGYKCPLCAKTFKNRPKLSVNYFISEMVQQFRSRKSKEEYEAKTEAEVQQMIQERREKIQEVKHSLELSRKDGDTVIADSVQVFTTMISCIERSQAELIDGIEEKQKTTEKQAEGFIKELQREITQLEKRSSELKRIWRTEDHLLNFPSIYTGWRPTKDWTKVKVHRSSPVGTGRTSVAQLEKTLGQEMKKIRDVELRNVQQYEVDVALDPDTANPWLILSEDGKQVSHGYLRKALPDNMGRFSRGVNVLGKQGFSSGRFYYEVQFTGKTHWTLGVVRESIERKGKESIPSSSNGYWTIGLRNGNKYMAAADPDVVLAVRENLQKVGVFVDYEAGLVSFYDVEARVLLHSFTGCTFTEKLYPFFCPWSTNNGRNCAPLIIRPVTVEPREDGVNMFPPSSKRRKT